MAVQTIKYENSADIGTDNQGNVLVDNAGNVIVPVTPPVVLFNAGLNNVINDHAPVVTGSVSYNGTTSGFSFNLPSENDKVYEYTPFNVKLVKHPWRNSVGVGVVLNLRTIKEQFGGEFEFSITAGGYYQNAPDAEIRQATIDGETWYYTNAEYQGYFSAVRWGSERTDLPAINRCGGDVNFGKFTVTCSDYSFEINTDNATISGGGRGESEFGYYYTGPCGEIWQNGEPPTPSETYEWRAVEEWCDGTGSTYYTGCIYDSDGNRIECTNDYIFSRTWAELKPNPGEDGYYEDLNRESVSQVSDMEYRRCAVVLDEFGNEYAYWRDESKDVNANYTLVELNKVVNNRGEYFYTDAINASPSDNTAIVGSNARIGWHKNNVATSATANPADYPYDNYTVYKSVYCNPQITNRVCLDANGDALKDYYWTDDICGGRNPCTYTSDGVTSLYDPNGSSRYFAIGTDGLCHNWIDGQWYTVYKTGAWDNSQRCDPVIGVAGHFKDIARWGVHVSKLYAERLGISIRDSNKICPGIPTYYCLEWEGHFYFVDTDSVPYGKGYVWKAEGNTVRAYTLSPCYGDDTVMPETIYERAAGSARYYATPEGDATSYELVRNNNNIYSLTPDDLASVLYSKNVPQNFENPTTIDEEFE